MSPQHRGHLAVADAEAGLQDDRRLPARQSRRIQSVFRQFVLLCGRLDLFGRDLLAVDGTRIKAVNNKDRNFTRNSLRNSSALPTSGWRTTSSGSRSAMSRMARQAAARARTISPRRSSACAASAAAHHAMLAKLERTGEDQISLTRSRQLSPWPRHTKQIGVGYNIQVAVDAKNKLIVEQAVTNQVVDMGLLTQTAEPAREVLGVAA